MGEGWRGIYRPKKQQTSGPKGRTSVAIAQRSRDYFVRLGIDRRVFQKVVDVRHFWHMSDIIIWQSKRCFIWPGITQWILWIVSRMSATLAYVHCTVHIIQLYYLLERTSGRGPPYVRPIDNNVHPAFQRTSAPKDKGVRLPTLVYVRSRRPPKMPFLQIIVTQSPN